MQSLNNTGVVQFESPFAKLIFPRCPNSKKNKTKPILEEANMKHFQRILAAIDFSKYSKPTLEHSANLARELECQLVIVNVINQREIEVMEYTLNKLAYVARITTLGEWVDGLKEDREIEMDKLAKVVDLSGLSYSLIIRSGVPYQELIRTIEREKADLVVMGVKGRSDLVDMMAGSTALKMFRRCPVPLITVRAHVE